jgi:hypothetical protein
VFVVVIRVEPDDDDVVHGDEEMRDAVAVVSAVTAVERDVQQVTVDLTGLRVHINVVIVASGVEEMEIWGNLFSFVFA